MVPIHNGCWTGHLASLNFIFNSYFISISLLFFKHTAASALLLCSFALLLLSLLMFVGQVGVESFVGWDDSEGGSLALLILIAACGCREERAVWG